MYTDDDLLMCTCQLTKSKLFKCYTNIFQIGHIKRSKSLLKKVFFGQQSSEQLHERSLSKGQHQQNNVL